MLAVSPDPVEKLAETRTRLDLGFPVASDPGLAGSRDLSIVFQRKERSPLPVPAVFVIGKGGMIHFSYVHPDYSVRLDMDVLAVAARSAARK